MSAVSLFVLVLAVFSVGLSVVALARDAPLEWRFALPEIKASGSDPQFETVLDYRPETGIAHAPAILVSGSEFQILWFEGSAEAKPDIRIQGVLAQRSTAGWQTTMPEPVITSEAVGAAMFPRQLVVTLGNVIENEAAPNAVFATIVSVGGWAMASVADVVLGKTGVMEARKLNLSPFLNRSHLVKSPMVAYADGSSGLPAYFEMGATHGSLVRLAPDGRVREIRRMAGQGSKPIQPMIVPQSETRAVALLRDFDRSGRLLISHTGDGGQSWSPVTQTELPNPSAPVAALRLVSGAILMAANGVEADGAPLYLALSEDDGVTWRHLKVLERDGGDARYPMLRRLGSGEIVLSYSHSTKQGIRTHVFNDAWVQAQ